MTQLQTPGNRIRAVLQTIAALLWFYIALSLARHGAAGLAHEQWIPLAQSAMLVFLLLLGFASMGLVYNRQMSPIGAQGLPLRNGWLQEVGLGLATGWTLAVVCVVPLALIGGIAIHLDLSLSAWGWLLADCALFAITALVEEVAFRGYGFQRLSQGFGTASAIILFTALYALIEAHRTGSSRLSVAVSVVLSLALFTAYLRTRALWVGWGLNFAWKASRGLLFGLAVSGDNSHSPLIQGDPTGPFWLTGGGFGLDGTWLAFIVLLLASPVIYRLTRELDFQYNAPVIVPGGIAVDLDHAAQAQHEAAMGKNEPAPPQLVQILSADVQANAHQFIPEKTPPGSH
jgi:membrane protease YdiL (CAAX protease family)